jgi:hypothetical protein
VSGGHVELVLAPITQQLLPENVVPCSFAEEDGFYTHLHVASRSPLDSEVVARVMLDPEHTNYDPRRYIRVSTQRDRENIQESSWYLHHSRASLWSLFPQPSRRALYLRAD